MQFTHEQHEISVQDHPLDGTLPLRSPEGKPTIIDSPEQLDDTLAGPRAPRCLDDWLLTDTPALVVHVISFTDATFITLTYSHSLVDGVGKREIVTNWCKVLAGRAEDVVPLADWGEEPMEVICRPLGPGEERHVHEDKQLKGWRKWYWVFRFIYERIANRNNYRQRNLFIPASTMARIRQSVEEGAEEEDKEKQKQPGRPYLSDNQLLTTWLVRLACLPFKSTNRPLGITSAVDLRGFPQLGGVRPGTVYLQNLLAYTWIHTTPAAVLRSPLASAAALMRAGLKPQLTLPQVRAAAILTHGGIKRSGTVDFFIGKDTSIVSVSSLAKAKYWKTIDFSPAVVKVGEGGKKGLAGRPVWQSSTPRSRLKPSCLIVIQGKDLQGNWFAQMVLSQRTWDMVEKELTTW